MSILFTENKDCLLHNHLNSYRISAFCKKKNKPRESIYTLLAITVS